MKAAILVKNVRFVHTGNSSTPNESQNSDSKSDKATNAILRSIQKLSCVCQNVEPLPEANGWTHARETVLLEDK